MGDNAGTLKQWVGFDVSRSSVTVVHLQSAGDGPLRVELDRKWPLQSGKRADAYALMFKRVTGYLSEHHIDSVAVLASAVSGYPCKMGQLEGAELRGVVVAASATVTSHVVVRNKSDLSRNSDRGRVQHYVDDDTFWVNSLDGKLLKGSKDIGYLLLKSAQGDVDETPEAEENGDTE